MDAGAKPSGADPTTAGVTTLVSPPASKQSLLLEQLHHAGSCSEPGASTQSPRPTFPTQLIIILSCTLQKNCTATAKVCALHNSAVNKRSLCMAFGSYSQRPVLEQGP